MIVDTWFKYAKAVGIYRLGRSDVQEIYNVVGAPGYAAVADTLRTQLRAGWRAALLPPAQVS